MRITTGLMALVAFFWPVLFAAAPSQAAASLDLNSFKCKTFLESSKEEVGYTLAWVDGYYKGEDEPPVIDFDKLKENAGTLADYCRQHPDSSVGAAAEELFGK